MQIKAHHPEDLEQLRQRSCQERDAKRRDRYRAVVLALEGHSAPAIARTLARRRRCVQLWVYGYRDRGLEGLGPKRQPGCPSKLPLAKQPSFRERLLAGPTEADGSCTLRAKDIRRILREELGVEYTVAGVYDLLHRLGFSCLAPRPRHRKNDPPQMRQWVEQAPPVPVKGRWDRFGAAEIGVKTPSGKGRCGTRAGQGASSPPVFACEGGQKSTIGCSQIVVDPAQGSE